MVENEDFDFFFYLLNRPLIRYFVSVYTVFVFLHQTYGSHSYNVLLSESRQSVSNIVSQITCTIFIFLYVFRPNKRPSSGDVQCCLPFGCYLHHRALSHITTSVTKQNTTH